MRVFLDANILVPVLDKEYPLFTYSSRVLSLANSSQFQIHTSPVCLAIAFYFAEKKSGSTKAKSKIELLVRNVEIAPTKTEAVLKAIQNKSIANFEDGIEYCSAEAAKCKCLITEDKRDFYFAKMEILNAEEFLKKYVMN